MFITWQFREKGIYVGKRYLKTFVMLFLLVIHAFIYVFKVPLCKGRNDGTLYRHTRSRMLIDTYTIIIDIHYTTTLLS